MRHVSGYIDGIPITINVPETLTEHREGAKANKGELKFNEGYLFDFGKPMTILTSNSNIKHDLAIIYFDSLNKSGIVTEVAYINKNCNTNISSIGFYLVALEVREDFVVANNIKSGSILILNEALKNE